ncbi:uncharacterized protein EV154DRAFT_494767 [Mucor mucedo]|uniref:uncharacterized protein n=1 Tax=Mucor mucedo TaxID=29922 RepID=UPI002220E527|nr:uncharacterized protein EV154DRAFT_494767 [Mucor mucedo]KAI7895736.1 hypothetical protein EV154DRAFT_494767 [Mucor mucedo]
MTSCIWALLSVNCLEFIHASAYDNLKGRSLFDLIHPDEVLLAKRDLCKFMDSELLGGSVTRCRLRDYSNNNFIIATPSWIVVDIIMYVATENLVLAFFHRQQDVSACGDHPDSSINQLRSSSLELYGYKNNAAAKSSPHQFLHILDNRTKSVLLSLPDHYPNEMDNGAQIEFFNDRTMPPEVSCFHCVQQAIRTTPSGEKIHRFVIEYGPITFLLTHIKKSLTSSLPSPPLYNVKRSLSAEYQYPKRIQYQYGGKPPPQRKHSAPTKLENLLSPVNKQQQQYHHRNHCQSCGTDSSPEWRRGPTGHKTLCNACGLRYSRSVARQGKIIANQQKQHSMFQSQHSPQSSPSSSSCSSPSSYKMNYQLQTLDYYNDSNQSNRHHKHHISYSVL